MAGLFYRPIEVVFIGDTPNTTLRGGNWRNLGKVDERN